MKSAVRTIEAAGKDAGSTVQRFVHERLGVSNAEAKGLIASGCVARNRRAVTRPDERVAAGDCIEVAAEAGRSYAGAARPPRGGKGWSIVHEDDDLVVVDKAPGVLTVPAAGPEGGSLEEMLLAAYRKRGYKKPGLHVVHRIDRFTSGLVVFGRHPGAAIELKRQFRERTPERIYLAVAEGRVEPERGRLVHSVVENPKSLKMRVAAEESAARPASLRYRVLERFAQATLLEVALETGRRNQIRLQFSAIGHPLVGDLAYGCRSPLIPRVALHAYRLAFGAPRGGKLLRFESAVPADFKRLLAMLRRDAAGAPPGDSPAGQREPAATSPRRTSRRSD